MPSPGRHVRARYKVPAKVGMRVTHKGRPAVITGFREDNLLIRIEGERGNRTVHPKSVVYPAAAAPPPLLPGVPVTSRTAPLTGGERVKVRQDVVSRWSANETVPEIAAATGHPQGLVRQLLAEGGVHDRTRRR